MYEGNASDCGVTPAERAVINFSGSNKTQHTLMSHPRLRGGSGSQHPQGGASTTGSFA